MLSASIAVIRLCGSAFQNHVAAAEIITFTKSLSINCHVTDIHDSILVVEMEQFLLKKNHACDEVYEVK